MAKKEDVGETAGGAPSPPAPASDMIRMKRKLCRDVARLMQYAMESGQLPQEVKPADVYAYDPATDTDGKQTALMADYLQILEQRFPDISARTLEATEPSLDEEGKTPRWRWLRRTEVGRYLVNIWIWIGLTIVAIFAVNLAEPLTESGQIATTLDVWQRAARYLEPFLYGALGAFLFLLRVSEQKLKERSFDPQRAPEHVNRVILGTISGGAIILLVEGAITGAPSGGTQANPPANDAGTLGDLGTYIKVSTAALGFLAGYSVDFLFQTIDRVIKALLPKVEDETDQKKALQKKTDALISRYQGLKDEAKTPEQKAAYQDLIDQLRGA